MDLEIYQVDSFTSETFRGNPAGVCITEEALDEELMFSIANEMALPETAFLCLSDFRLRWFSPKVEVTLCGHATLAVAHILKQKGIVAIGEEVQFNTLSGALIVKVTDRHIEMVFPAPVLQYSEPIIDMLNHLDIQLEHVISFASFESKHLIEITDEKILHQLKPNFDGLKQLKGRAVVVTVRTEAEGTDFVSRNFAPWVGVNEDPVTGSAHCALGVHWGQKLNKTLLTGYQASERGGFVSVELLSNQKIKLIGNAITVLSGVMHI